MSLLKRIEKKDPSTTVFAPASNNGNGGSSAPGLNEPVVRQRQTPAPPQDKLVDLRGRMLTKIIADLDPNLDIGHSDELRRSIEELFNRFLSEEPDIVLGRVE